MIQISEQEKFTILQTIIEAIGHKVRVVVRAPTPWQRRQAIDGVTDLEYMSIKITVTPQMTEEDWSEAGAVLAHEYGHCERYTYSERKAWENADKFLRSFEWLRPKNFEKVRTADLANYKQRKGLYTKNEPVFCY